MFSPEKVIEWYNKKPKWGKILFFIVFIFGIILSICWFAFKKTKDQNEFSENINELESHFKEKINETKKKDEDIVQKIKIEQERRKKLEEERLKRLKEAQDVENEINKTDNIYDAVSAINKNRRERRKNKT